MSGDIHDLYLQFLNLLHYDKIYASGMFITWGQYVEKVMKNSFNFFNDQDAALQEFADFVDHNGFLVYHIPSADGIDALLITRE